LQGFAQINTLASSMSLSICSRLKTALCLVIFAALICAMNGCGGSSRDIIGKWRTADANAIVWEFSPNGSVLVGKDKGRYTFGDQKRIKIQTSFATSVYQMQIVGDTMTLTSPSGLKLELTRIK
jgi:hypothetical protein